MKLERLATQLDEARLPAGTMILRLGDPGDRFYVIADGEVEIEDARHGPGAFFGEIALLRDVPRTASVQAATDVRLLTLDRDEFLAAVTGHEPSAAAAEAVVTARLGSLRPELASP
jgi:CRP-like cAMP-binding protein